MQVAPAQSLGDYARREAERRTQFTAGRVYTNTDLAPVDAPAPSPAPVPVEAATGSGAAAPATPAPGEEVQPPNNGGIEPVIVKAREKRDEQYWRTLVRDLRGRVTGVNANITARETRLAEIDAGPQTPTTVREREIISATVTGPERDARFLTRARIAAVPEEWIR